MLTDLSLGSPWSPLCLVVYDVTQGFLPLNGHVFLTTNIKQMMRNLQMMVFHKGKQSKQRYSNTEKLFWGWSHDTKDCCFNCCRLCCGCTTLCFLLHYLRFRTGIVILSQIINHIKIPFVWSSLTLFLNLQKSQMNIHLVKVLIRPRNTAGH